MFCKKCGLPLSDDALFCSNCGTPTNASTNSNVQEPESNNNNADQHIDAPKPEDRTNTNNPPAAGSLNVSQNQTGSFNQLNTNNQPQQHMNYNQPQQPQQPGSYNQFQQSNYNSWQQNPQQFNSYPQGPAAPRKNQQTVFITAVIAVIVVVGLIFGGIKLFSGKDSGSGSSSTSPSNSTTKSKPIKDLIVGTWDGYQINEKTSSSTMKFQKNGTCTIEENTDSYEGTYKIDESDKSNVIIELELTDPEGDTQTLSLTLKKVNDDKFQLIRDDDPDAKDPLTLTRHK